MDLFEVVNKRLSYRGEFRDINIPKNDLIKIVDTGLKAPSGKNLQTTEFVIIDDEEILKIIKDLDLPDFTKKLIDVNFH
jgi:nitroreductase